MTKKKRLFAQNESPDGPGPRGEEDSAPQEEKEPLEHKGIKSIAQQVTGKAVAVAVVGLVLGLVFGQVVLPAVGVGLVSMPVAGQEPEPCAEPGDLDLEGIEAKVEGYLNDNVLGPQGVEGEILSLEPYDDDFYELEVDITQGGQSLGTQVLYLTKSGKAISGSVLFLEEDTGDVEPAPEPEPTEKVEVVGELTSFDETSEDLVLEDGKPVILLFTTTWCPHCTWIKDTFDSVVKEYAGQGKIVARHWELDTGDDTLTEEVETEVDAGHEALYRKLNPRGSIPTFVFGGKYFRIGNAHEAQDDLAAEEADFRAVIEALVEEANQ